MPTQAEIDAWAAEFQRQHGRRPTDEDYSDWQWSQQFLRTYGRPPTMDDWRAHWFSSRGYSSGGQAQQQAQQQQTVGELLQLKFPAYQAGVPSYIRDWLKYLQEVTQNQSVTPTTPLATKVEEGKEPTPLQKLQQETARLLGLDSAQLADEDLLTGWQKFIDALRKAPFEAQKSLLRLRWDTEKGWHEVGVPEMPNPREL